MQILPASRINCGTIHAEGKLRVAWRRRNFLFGNWQ